MHDVKDVKKVAAEKDLGTALRDNLAQAAHDPEILRIAGVID
jgi:hypothetical protein